LIDSAEEKAVTHTVMVKDQQKVNVVVRLLGRGFAAAGTMDGAAAINSEILDN
jgi:hypothetical protein